MHIYFAYGSNMDENQLKKRCPDAKRIGKAILTDHKIGFTRHSNKWDSAVADILVYPGEAVWGILYELSQNDLDQLDKIEGHPTIYIRKKLSVLKVNYNEITFNEIFENRFEGERIEAYVYEVVNKEKNLYPKLNYLIPILDAAFDNYFPIKYQNNLTKFGNKDYDQKLKKIIDAFLEIEELVKNGINSKEFQKQEEWGGANLVITGEISRKEQLNREYPHDIVVLTNYWKELSWLVETIYSNRTISWQIDAANKHYFFTNLGIAANNFIAKCKHNYSSSELSLVVLYEAYRIITFDFYRKF